jgi:molybdopterin/thiamine biosynthesis adenylyltransferase
MSHELASELAGAAARRDVTTFRPVLLDAAAPDTPAALLALTADTGVVVVDELGEQLEQLVKGRVPREELSGSRCREAVERVLEGREPVAFGTWVFYPWSRRLVHVLPEPLHHELRFDRNRYAITAEEQGRLLSLRVAVAGLSVGRAVVSTMVHEGIGGELRLADFDVLDLSNLNRVAGGVADVGVNKVVLAGREVAELDPYIRVVALPCGVDETTIADFVADVDVIVDECDDLEMKVRLREHARAARRPVVMATSHRGMLDVERFDLEPDRPPFHGLLGDVTSAQLGGLTTKQKVPYVIRILDPASLTDRAAASMVEVKETVSTWPQLASDVALGGAMVANAVRRIALDGFTGSGRFYADLDELTADGRQVPPAPAPAPVSAPAPAAVPRMPPAARGSSPSREEIAFVVACATSAPSGGNIQPWRFQADGHVIRAWVDPTRSSLLDFRQRGALLALGAAMQAAEIGARALGFEPVARPVAAGGPAWELALERSADARDAAAVEVLWQRCCNRRRDGVSQAVPEAALLRLARCGAPLEASVFPHEALAELGGALGALDRVRFLSSRLRRELIGELRFTAEQARASRDGIDVASLELDDADLAAMDVLKSGAGMDLLAGLDRGWGLGNAARDAFAASAGAIVLRAAAVDRGALVDAGRGLMRLWLDATRRGLAVHPWGSPFLFQRLLEDVDSLEGWERHALTHAAEAFGRVVGLERDRPVMLILRVSCSAPPSTRSLRRATDEVLAFAA